LTFNILFHKIGVPNSILKYDILIQSCDFIAASA